MTRTVRIGNVHATRPGRDQSLPDPGPAACANGTDVLASAVLRLADQP